MDSQYKLSGMTNKRCDKQKEGQAENDLILHDLQISFNIYKFVIVLYNKVLGCCPAECRDAEIKPLEPDG